MSLSWSRPTADASTRVRTGAWCGALTALLLAIVVLSTTVGPVAVGHGTVLKAMLDAVAVPVPAGGVGTWHLGPVSVPGPVVDLVWFSPLSFDVPATERTIVVTLRLPRILMGACVGFALATAGTVMQGFFRNPMADPSIIGVSSGGAVGAVAVIVAPVAIPFGLPVAAFVGAMVAAFGVYAIATQDGRTPVATLLLAGVAVQTFLGAVVSYMLVKSGRNLREAYYWLVGHLDAATWGKVGIVLSVSVVCFLVLFAYARDLNLLLLGEEDAGALGVDVERTKRILLAVSSILTGAAVAVSGVIGFVGLIVPHLMRLVVGPDHRILLPTSALAGAAFLVATDTLARSGTVELPVGILTAFLGAPFFLFLLRKREVHAL
jgi:iron complex transport system permease protein